MPLFVSVASLLLNAFVLFELMFVAFVFEFELLVLSVGSSWTT